MAYHFYPQYLTTALADPEITYCRSPVASSKERESCPLQESLWKIFSLSKNFVWKEQNLELKIPHFWEI